EWEKIPKFMQWFLWGFPILIGIYFFNNNTYDLSRLFSREEIAPWLLILGAASQLLFNFRFVYQWIYSERQQESSLPLGFWTLSLAGSVLILIYAIFRRDPVLFIGQFFVSIIYTRNVILIRRTHV